MTKKGLPESYQKLDVLMGILFVSAQNENAPQTAIIAEHAREWIDGLDDSEKRIIVPEIGSKTTDLTKIGGKEMFFTNAVSLISYFVLDPALQNDQPILRRNGDEDPYRSACKTGNLALVTLRDLGVAMSCQGKPVYEDIAKIAIRDSLSVS